MEELYCTCGYHHLRGRKWHKAQSIDTLIGKDCLETSELPGCMSRKDYKITVVVSKFGSAAKRSLRLSSSSTSHCAHINLPARNLASGLASQTAKLPGKLTTRTKPGQRSVPSRISVVTAPQKIFSRTVFPDEETFTSNFNRTLGFDGARVEVHNSDVRVHILHGEVLHHLVHGCFARAITYGPRLGDLASGGRSRDDDPRAGGLKSQEFLDDVERADDVGVKGRFEIVRGDLSAGNESMAAGGVGDEDVDFADFFKDGGDAVVVGDGGGVGGDLGVWILV